METTGRSVVTTDIGFEILTARSRGGEARYVYIAIGRRRLPRYASYQEGMRMLATSQEDACGS